jgi:hypothetical protein
MIEARYARPLGVAFAIALSACRAAGRHEADALYDAVDLFRRADGAGRGGRVQAVAALECTEPRVCEAKRVCLEAIDPTSRALALKDEVSARVADLEQKRLAPDAPEIAALPGKLDEAARLLQTGRAKMSECESKLAELRVDFGR